jgi:hypothetical protein
MKTDPMMFINRYTGKISNPRDPLEVTDREFERARKDVMVNCPEEKRDGVIKFLFEVEIDREEIKRSPLYKAFNEEN